jgi:hypothetical protein
MGRRNKNIEVEIQETKKNTETYTDLEVIVNRQVIGTVQQEEGEQARVSFKSGRERTANTVEEAIQMIIAEYNLHDQ